MTTLVGISTEPDSFERSRAEALDPSEFPLWSSIGSQIIQQDQKDKEHCGEDCDRDRATDNTPATGLADFAIGSILNG